MSIEQYAYLGEIVAAAAVIASLIDVRFIQQPQSQPQTAPYPDVPAGTSNNHLAGARPDAN